ncbi:porin family protein [Aliamphritea ceti]|nr:porin family protein [Aliamphritea ceti]
MKRTINNTKSRETQSGPLLGVGIMYQFGQWDLRAEYEQA